MDLEAQAPGGLRGCLEEDYFSGAIDCTFAARFYDRLFRLCPSLRTKFSKLADQPAHLANAVRHLVEFEPVHRGAIFHDHVAAHRQMGVIPEEADAFRYAFVEEVVASGGRPARGISARTRGDAWNAVLKMGIDAMLGR